MLSVNRKRNVAKFIRYVITHQFDIRQQCVALLQKVGCGRRWVGGDNLISHFESVMNININKELSKPPHWNVGSGTMFSCTGGDLTNAYACTYAVKFGGLLMSPLSRNLKEERMGIALYLRASDSTPLSSME